MGEIAPAQRDERVNPGLTSILAMIYIGTNRFYPQSVSRALSNLSSPIVPHPSMMDLTAPRGRRFSG